MRKSMLPMYVLDSTSHAATPALLCRYVRMSTFVSMKGRQCFQTLVWCHVGWEALALAPYTDINARIRTATS